MDLDTLYGKALEVSKDIHEFENALNELKNQLEFEYRMRNRRAVVELKDIDRVVFFGDIHGDIETLYAITKKIDLTGLLKNGWRAVFLGDYIDRGSNQIETLAFIAMLKSVYPSKVITLRGNHEPYGSLIPYPHDFPYHLINRFGRSYGQELYDLSRDLFNLMPLVLYVPGKVLAVHGGPPISRVLRYNTAVEILSVESDDEAIEEILWSDPIEDYDIEFAPNYRGAGKLWGIPITIATISKLSVKLIVRGHEPVNGYELRHKGRVLTLFTMKGYYGNAQAACFKVDLSKLENIDEAARNSIVTV